MMSFILSYLFEAPVLGAYLNHYSSSSQNEGGIGDLFVSSFASYPAYWIIFIGSMLASLIVSSRLKSRMAEYSQEPMPMTGAEAAEQMLSDNHIYDVTVHCTPGELTDHYNPVNKTVNLSEAVYYGNNVASVAVAAHECGHAVQHATAYAWLTMRSKLVPIVSLSSNLVGIVLMIGMVMLMFSHNPTVLGIGVALLAMTTLFSFVTLPVELNASSRALTWMRRGNVASYVSQTKARSALFWAAMTYVVAALSSLAMLLHYLAIFMSARNRD